MSVIFCAFSLAYISSCVLLGATTENYRHAALNAWSMLIKKLRFRVDNARGLIDRRQK